MVLPRVLTPLIFAPIVVAAIWFGTIPFFILVLGVCLFCTWEFCLIADEGGYPNQLALSLLGTVGLLFALYFDGMPIGPIYAAPSPIFIFILWLFVFFLLEFFATVKFFSF